MLVAVRPVLLEKVDIIFGNAEQQSPFSLSNNLLLASRNVT